jgi:hypothetical protein
VVTFMNGRCGIARNGTAIDGLEWELSELAKCTAKLIRLARLDGGGTRAADGVSD